MTFTDDLRRAASEPVPDLAGLLVTAAWHIERLVQRVALLSGQPEGAVALSEGLGGHSDTRQTGSIAPGAVSGAVGADSARIAPRTAPDRPDWYSTAGWEHRDDAHAMTFEEETGA